MLEFLLSTCGEVGSALNITLRTVASVAVALDVDPRELSVPVGRLRAEKSVQSE